MSKDEFRNGLCILGSIDLHELQKVGLWQDAIAIKTSESWLAWKHFRDDPYRFFMRADDDTTDKIWRVMKKRGAAFGANLKITTEEPPKERSK
jgi:hypothetical protein